MRYYVIAGEASGDLHGSNLLYALQKLDPQTQIRGWGGDKMQAAGMQLVKHIKDLAFMGFVEVAMNLRTILKNIKFCKQDISQFRPDVLILIDYPGFNLRIAEWAKKAGIKVVYYISPQIWAWKENRIHQIKQSVDKMLVILPFEKSFYHKHGMEVVYTGHPLSNVIRKEMQVPPHKICDKPIIALLPGSREQEIKKKLPIMLQMVEKFPEYQFVVAHAPAQPLQLYTDIIGTQTVLIHANTYNLLKQAKAALVTSGTATLETALFGVPQIVCYKGNPLSYWLAKRLIKIKYISLVNLILDRPAVTELIQKDLNPTLLYQHLNAILHDYNVIDKMESNYLSLIEKLETEDASLRAAQEIYKLQLASVAKKN